MIDSTNNTFYINVATPTTKEGTDNDISPFPTFDEESLLSGNSIETEPDSPLSSDDDDSDSDESDSDDSDSDSDDSSPHSYVIDDHGVSLLANLNRKLLEHRYGKNTTTCDTEVANTTEIMDETMETMKGWLADGGTTVIPKSSSSDKRDTNPTNEKEETIKKLMENLSPDEFQALVKTVMGKEMPESREDGETGKREEAPLDGHVPNVVERLSGSTTSIDSSLDSAKKKKGVSNKSSKKQDVETIPVTTGKVKRGFGFLKKLKFFKKNKAKSKKVDANKSSTSTKAMKKSKKSSSSTKPETVPDITPRDDAEEERDAPEPTRVPSAEGEQRSMASSQRNETNTPIVACIVDTNDVDAPPPVDGADENTKEDKLSFVDAVEKAESETGETSEEAVAKSSEVPLDTTPGTESKEEPTEEIQCSGKPTESTSGSQEPALNTEPAEEEDTPPEPLEDTNPTIEEPILNANSDIISIVSEVTGNGAEVEVFHDAIDTIEVLHVLPEAPLSPTAQEYANSLADLGEKNIGRRFSKVLRGKKKNTSIPTSEEVVDGDSVKLTPENPVIEIPLSEMKPRRSLMSKYVEKKPKFSSVTSPKAVGNPLSAKQQSASNRGEAMAEEEAHQPVSPKVKSPKASETSVKASSGASVSSKKSTKSSKSRKSTKSSKSKKKKFKQRTEETPVPRDVKTPVEEILKTDSNGFESLRGWKDSDMDSFEEAGGLMCCGMGNSAGKNDWFTGVEKSFTQMFDYCDHTPEEAYENTKIYEEEDDEGSVTSRFSKRSITRSRSKTRRVRSTKSSSDRSVGSRGGSVRSKRSKSRSVKSVRSKSRSDKSVSEKSTKSRSKSHSDKSVGGRSTKSRSKSIKSTTKAKETKTVNDSSSKSAAESTKKASNASKKETKSAKEKSVKPKNTRNAKTGSPTLEKLKAVTSKSQSKVKASPAKKVGKSTAKKN